MKMNKTLRSSNPRKLLNEQSQPNSSVASAVGTKCYENTKEAVTNSVWGVIRVCGVMVNSAR